MVKYIVLCLNALAKLQNPKKASRHQALMGNCSTCSHIPWLYQYTKWFAISLLWVWDSVATREEPVKKRLGMKCIQVNVLKNIARMIRRIYVHIMSHKRFRVSLHSVVAWTSTISLLETERYLEFKWLQRDSNPQTLCKRKFFHLAKLAKWLNG